jgi:hypothetical protein
MRNGILQIDCAVKTGPLPSAVHGSAVHTERPGVPGREETF